MLRCTICDEEVPFHTGTDTENLVCKSCIRINKELKVSKTTGPSALQMVFDKSLEMQPKGLIEMKRLKLYCNFARDKVVMFDDVVVRFDENGHGTTPSHNRSKITKFMKQRPNRVSIVEDAPEEVLVEVPPVVEAPVVDPPKEEPVVEVEAPVVVPTEVEVEAPKETKEPQKRGRKSKKKDTEDN